MGSIELGVGKFLLLAVLSSVPLPGEGRADELGRDLYRGLQDVGASARVGNEAVSVPAWRLPCSNCHGRDARGGGEGAQVAPPITRDALERAARGRLPYGLQSFIQALRKGVRPDGRQLSWAMPRFDFDDAQTEAIYDYLAEVGAEQRTGVEPDVVRFALTVPAGRAPVGEAVKRAFDAAWLDLGDPRPHGRRPELSVVEMEAGREPAGLQVFALLLSMPDASGQLFPAAARDGVPVLFPFAQAEGTESPADLRTAFTTVGDQLSALFSGLGRDAVVVADAAWRRRLGDYGLDRGRRVLSVEEFLRLAAPPEEILLLAGPEAVRSIASSSLDLRGTAVLRPWTDAIRSPSDALALKGATVLVSVPYDPERWSGNSLSAAHLAAIAASVIRNALAASGRDLTRSRFMSAIGKLNVRDPNWPELDYRRFPLGGMDDAGVVAWSRS